MRKHYFKRITRPFLALVLAVAAAVSMYVPASAACNYSVAYPDEGDYEILSACDNNFAIDVCGGGDAAACTSLQLYQRNGTDAQIVTIRRVDGDWYTITHKRTGMVLNVVNGSSHNDARLWLYPYDGTDACHFRFIDMGNGRYAIQNKLDSQRIIDLDNGICENGSIVHLWDLHDSVNGQWYLNPVSSPSTSYTAYVKTAGGKLNLRSAPSTSSSVVAKLANGSEVTVLETSNGWAKVKAGGKTGYVSQQYLTTEKSAGKISLSVPDFKQYDSRWGSTKIGSKTIKQIGCLTVSAAMAQSYKTGSTIYPNAMRQQLRYSNNDLIWSSLTSLGYTRAAYNQRMNNDMLTKIYQQLAAGHPVIVGAKRSSGGQHWVVIKGFTGTSTTNFSASDFIINDPNSISRTTLSSYLNVYPTVIGLVY